MTKGRIPWLMKHRKRLWKVMTGLGITAWMVSILLRFQAQRRELAELRDALSHAAARVASPPATFPDLPRPSDELLQARAKVAQLLRERHEDRTSASKDGFGLGHSGPSAISIHPDYRAATSLQNRGMATPDDALETLFWYFAEPGRLKPGNEGEIYTWTIQNRPIPPGWHWDITDGGLGSARLEGFRILTRREISPEEVAFEIERSENAQTVVEVRRFVRIDKGWKCQTQAHLEPPPGDHAPQ